MLTILKDCNYSPPLLKPYTGKNISVVESCFRKNYKKYRLYINNCVCMTYNTWNHVQALELVSHYQLAKGHCICTGMGFGVRENWLMQKKEVTKITIVERNEELIEYHKYINSPFLKECEVIIGDASEMQGKCDTLLLDHYELETKEYIVDDVKKISRNVDCETLWFWPIERIILNYENYSTYYQNYLQIKNKFNLSKLPNIDEERVNLFCNLHYYSNILSQ